MRFVVDPGQGVELCWSYRGETDMTTTYATKSAAVRAARMACKKAIGSVVYSAVDQHDYIILEKDVPGYLLQRFSFKLKGPCLEAMCEAG